MKRNRKGIVIITTMLLLSVIIMIAALLVVTGRSTLLLGASYSDREQAYYAAECGIAYAQHCISKFKDWTADETTLSSVYNPGFTDFSVSAAGSQKNCVRGVLTSNGSEFYITFYSGTWNDSSSPRKDVDRSGNLGTPLKYYSFNNISDEGSASSEYLDDAGNGKTFRTMPGGYAHIIVEGRCNQVRRYAEAMLTRNSNKTGSACSVAAGGIDVDLLDNDSVFLVDSVSGYDSRIRSMGDINVKSKTGDKNCYQIANSGSSCTGSDAADAVTKVNNTTIKQDDAQTQSDYGISCENKSQDSYLGEAKLKWSDVTKKYISGSTYDSSKVKTTIAAGTYVYMNSAADANTYKLYYYPPTAVFNPEAAKGETGYTGEFVNDNGIPGGATPPAEFNTATHLSGSDLTIQTSVSKSDLTKAGNYLFKASNPVGVAPVTTNGTTGGDFALAIYDCQENGKYAPSEKYRVSVKLEGTDEQDPCLVSQSDGDIYIEGELSGKGKIMSGGELSFQGKSLLEADVAYSSTGTEGEAIDAGLSIYAQGSVNIDPVNGSGGAKDPNDDIMTAWNNLIEEQDYSASGDYYKSDLTDYKTLQEKLLNTKVDGTALKDVLKNDYKYDKATIQEMINTVMAKNTYIGTDTSTSTTGGTAVASLSTSTKIDSNTFKITSRVSGSNTFVTIANTRDEDCCYIKVKASYVNGVLTMTVLETIDENNKLQAAATSTVTGTTGTVSIGSGTGSYNLTYDPTNSDYPWTIGATTESNNQSSESIMLHKTSSGFTELSTNDTILKGLVYTWKNFKARDLGGGALSIRGGIVAYGGDPASQSPGANGYGKIDINGGKYVTFTYDPDYMKLIFDCSSGVPTKRVMQNSF